MSTPFVRALNALNADALRGAVLGISVAALLLGAWTAWFTLAEVGRYLVTDVARLEADEAHHPVQAPIDGRVAASRLVLATEVNAGDVLLELDAQPKRLELQEERTRLAALEPQLKARREELAASERGSVQALEAARAGRAEARAQLAEAEALAGFADKEAQRFAWLHARDSASLSSFEKAGAEAEQRKAAVERRRLAVSRLELEEQTRDSDRQAQVKRLLAEISRLQGQKSTAAAAIERLEHDIERHRIRAPIAGRLGEAAPLRAGAFVTEGDKLATIVPAGTLKLIAEFMPSEALGRIRPGQPARLRLHGFAWAQYGSIPATVSRVAGELRDGRVRVELALNSATVSAIPMQHGLPGSVEVEVERMSPATLVLRAAGRLITEPRSQKSLPDTAPTNP